MIDAVILCGGKGTRLASVVSALPKPLAPVLGRPFLDYVLDYLSASSLVQRVTLATGHLAEQISGRYGAQYGNLQLEYSTEATPLGTGGALLQASRRRELSSPFLLLNGDSFVDADLQRMTALHTLSGAGMTLALFDVEDAGRYGTVQCVDGKVSGFIEKSGIAAPGAINSGVYLVEPAALLPWRQMHQPLSLESDIMPQLVAAGRVHGLRTGQRFIDIGLPETYHAAADFFAAGAPPSGVA